MWYILYPLLLNLLIKTDSKSFLTESCAWYTSSEISECQYALFLAHQNIFSVYVMYDRYYATRLTATRLLISAN